MKNETFGMRISTLRQAQGLTPAQLAQQLQVPEETVLNWESGITAPDLLCVSQLAYILKVTPDTLSGGLFPFDFSVSPDAANQANTSGGKQRHIPLCNILSAMFAAGGIISVLIISLLLQRHDAAFPVGSLLFACGILLPLCRIPTMWKKAVSPPSTQQFASVKHGEFWICANIVLLAALLPLYVFPELDHRPVYSAVFAGITAVSCFIAVRIINMSCGIHQQDSRNLPVLRLRRLFCILLCAALLVTLLLHMTLGAFLQNAKVFYGKSIVFSDWDSFLRYVQTPLASDGKSTLTLLSIENSGNNLRYHYTDPDGNDVIIQDALTHVLAADEMTVLYSYLNINQFIYDVSFGRSNNRLPVEIHTIEQHQQALTGLRTFHIIFCSIYLLEIPILYLLYRKKRRAIA